MYLLSILYVPGSFIGTGNIEVSKLTKISALIEPIF